MRVHARACAHRGPSFLQHVPSFILFCMSNVHKRTMRKEKMLYIVVLRNARQWLFFFFCAGVRCVYRRRKCGHCEDAATAILYIFFFLSERRSVISGHFYQ
ncbi:unnamed protein product [Ixodes pacificus]